MHVCGEKLVTWARYQCLGRISDSCVDHPLITENGLISEHKRNGKWMN